VSGEPGTGKTTAITQLGKNGELVACQANPQS
jgi:broad-specificity NMP kinase